MEKRRNRFEALIGITMGLTGLVVLGYILWSHSTGVTAAEVPTTPPQAVTALWDAYRQARAVAQVEAADAQLVSASTQWQEVTQEMLLRGSDDWSFVFYSPSSGHVLDVTLAAGVAQVVNQTQVWVTPRVLDEGNWQEGPRNALLVFLAYSGKEFLGDHPQAVVDLNLAARESGRAAWTIAAVDSIDMSVLSSVVDAETHQVLFTNADQ